MRNKTADTSNLFMKIQKTEEDDSHLNGKICTYATQNIGYIKELSQHTLCKKKNKSCIKRTLKKDINLLALRENVFVCFFITPVTQASFILGIIDLLLVTCSD